jgi:hypothetical protein
MNTIIQANLNSKEPWPGLAWFEEADQPFFRGRADETAELLRLVRPRQTPPPTATRCR